MKNNIAKLNKIVKRCEKLHNCKDSKRLNIQKLSDAVAYGYDVAFDIMKNAIQDKNIELFENVYYITNKLIPDTSKRDSVYLDWLQNKYKKEFCTNVVYLISENYKVVLFPRVKAMENSLKTACTESQKSLIMDRLSTIYNGFPLHFYKRKPNEK